MKTRDTFWYDLFNRRLSRRDVLRIGRDASALIALGALSDCAPRRLRAFLSNPFVLGVASGDPEPDGVVLWTRLTRSALNEIGVEREAPVSWEIAADDAFRNVVRRGDATALPELGYSVHAEVKGLQPARPYWYRFHAGGMASPIGRTQTAPAADAQPAALRFAFVSCQNYEHGYYTAYRHLAAEDLDLVVHLGDYIYEKRFDGPQVRQHESGEVFTLDDYRGRYTQYRSDVELQAAHAMAPWIVTPDDHEVSNDYADLQPQEGDRQTPEQFPLRRAAAYQAYYEFMPLRRASMPRGPGIRLYRRLEWGRLARFHILDERQHRTNQPCGGRPGVRCAAASDPGATMLGAAQEQWLFDGLRQSPARWNLLANQVLIAQLARAEQNQRTFSMDNWNGYPTARRRLLDFLGQARPSNPLVITGDIHANWVADLKPDFDDANSPVVASEFVGTSVSSGGDGRDTSPRTEADLAANPHIKFFNGQRGYVRCNITAASCVADYRVVPYVTRVGAPVETRAAFVIEAGRAGVQRI